LGGSVGSANKLVSNPVSPKKQSLDTKQWPTHPCLPYRVLNEAKKGKSSEEFLLTRKQTITNNGWHCQRCLSTGLTRVAQILV
jgi:hypothetical protein